jgi:hypothetical protein
MPALENPNHELFAEFLFQGIGQEQAYVKAGYKPSPSAASRLFRNVKIQERLKELKDRSASNIVLGKSYVLEAMIENIEKGLGRRPVKIGPKGETRDVYVYRGDVANRAIQLAGIECNMFIEKREHTHKTPYDNMTLEQLVAEVEREAKLALEYNAPVIIDNELEGGE